MGLAATGGEAAWLADRALCPLGVEPSLLLVRPDARRPLGGQPLVVAAALEAAAAVVATAKMSVAEAMRPPLPSASRGTGSTGVCGQLPLLPEVLQSPRAPVPVPSLHMHDCHADMKHDRFMELN